MANVYTADIQAYMDKQNATKAYNSTVGTGYSTNKDGQLGAGYNNGTTNGTVTPYSIFDPNSSNYNSKVANSNGTINLSNQGDYGSAGQYTGANSGLSQSQSQTQDQMRAQYQNTYGSGSVSSSGSGYDPTADITALGASRKQAAILGLSNARDKSLSDLSAANGKIEPAYYNQRDSVSTDNQIGAKNFAEFLSQRGSNNAVGNSGSMAQNNIANNVSLQGSLGNLATSQASAYADNAKSVADVGVAYNNDVASTSAGIDATNMEQLVNARTQAEASRLAQANADRSYNYQVSRDTVGDTNYTNQNTYNQGQDLINQTGKLSDGTYTQQGQSNATAQQLQVAQLAEIQNPNSTTNQLSKLGLKTAQLNYTQLPSQLKSQAQLIAQQLASGAIDLKTAQLKLNYLPTQIQQEISQNNAQLNATNRSNTGGSGGSGGSSSAARKESASVSIMAAYNSITDAVDKKTFLDNNAAQIKKETSATYYNELVKKWQGDYAYHVLETPNEYSSWNMQNLK